MASRLLSGSLAAGCRKRLATSVSVPPPPLQRQRGNHTTTAHCSASKTSTPLEEAVSQQTAAGPQKPEQQLAMDSPTGSVPKKQKHLVMPSPVLPPKVPADPSAWDNAMLLVDKPKGWTSFDVCGKLRPAIAALLRRKNRDVKVGHAGTLDPMATGLLIVCVGRGTKAVDSFMAMRKEYSGTLRLGEGTPSFDAESPVEQRAPWEHITDEDLLRVREGLVGEIQQLPPMYSAIKVGGQKLYEAARKGQEVERQPRTVTVECFDLQRDATDAQSVHFRVVCSKGTYIRSLAHDLGAALGSAAHLTALRRDAIGTHSVVGAWDVQQLAQQLYAQRDERNEQQAKQEQQALEQEQEQAAVTAAEDGDGLTPS
ncbi:hypothetical protein D9Q98_000451 [Chlorella vulgaris]|uniref:tRNA pseudouridine(55) synthase n=1 Tax=Chlorella vulgaris TaxID=3077 RepID=A0A9D4Z161_CHLVU|nr:hypothetical protein D9Q98_000451 [Chlorella vulgaris]